MPDPDSDSAPAATRPPFPFDILVGICCHLAAQIPELPHLGSSSHDQHDGGSSPTLSLSSKKGGTARANAALRYLYANVEGADLCAVGAGMEVKDSISGSWPNHTSHERKLAALRWVRNLSVSSWPMLYTLSEFTDDDYLTLYDSPEDLNHRTQRNRDDDRDRFGALQTASEYAFYETLLGLQKDTRLFPRLEAIIFHSAAIPWLDTETMTAEGAFQRIHMSLLYELLTAEPVAHVCTHLPPPPCVRGSNSVAYCIGFTQHLLNTWAESASTTDGPPKLSIHNLDFSNPPVVETSMVSAPPLSGSGPVFPHSWKHLSMPRGILIRRSGIISSTGYGSCSTCTTWTPIEAATRQVGRARGNSYPCAPSSP